MKIFRAVVEVETPDDWGQYNVNCVLSAQHIRVLTVQELKKGSHQVKV